MSLALIAAAIVAAPFIVLFMLIFGFGLGDW